MHDQMIRKVKKAISQRSIRVPFRIKLLMYGACGVPILLVLWALMRQFIHFSEARGIVTFLSCMASLGAFSWLLARLHCLSSFELDENGLTQTFLSLHKGLGSRIFLPWERVSEVSFVRFSYKFKSDDGRIYELNTAFFSDSKEVISAVQSMLPLRLRSQM